MEVEVPPNPEPADRPTGDFERYGLLAAMTLVVLALLLADRMRPSRDVAALPPEDRLLRIEIGGAPPTAPRPAPRAGAGRVVALDAPSRPRPQPSPPPSAARSHVVRAGETLTEIARRELGSSRRVAEIVALNGLDDPDRLAEGATLRLPPR